MNKQQTNGTPFAVPVPGASDVNTIKQMFPGNSTDRTNPINGTDLKNSLGSFPKTMNDGLAKQWENIRLLAETFEPHIASRGFEGHRKIFSKVEIPLHSNTLSMTFMKTSGIDENPVTAAITGLTGWDPKWNEVAITGSSVEITTNAYGRFYKRHRFAEDISTINWFEELAMYFRDNATRTLDNLASIRLFEGSNKLFVKQINAFNEQTPFAPRLQLGASAAEVNANLNWESLKEAKHLMQDYTEVYNIVNPQTGAITEGRRKAVIPGYYGDNYLVLVSANGHNQLMADPEFRKQFVINGGYYAQSVVEQTLGLSTPVMHFQLEIVKNPLTISKAQTPIVSTEGQQALECAFVIGGNNGARIAVELSLQGWTKMINIGYEDSAKIDPFSLLSLSGWMTVTDFSVIRNECIYCIPYVKQTFVASGNVSAPTNPTWKK